MYTPATTSISYKNMGTEMWFLKLLTRKHCKNNILKEPKYQLDRNFAIYFYLAESIWFTKSIKSTPAKKKKKKNNNKFLSLKKKKKKKKKKNKFLSLTDSKWHHYKIYMTGKETHKNSTLGSLRNLQHHKDKCS